MGLLDKLFGSETSTKVEMPKWQSDALQSAIREMDGLGVPQLNPDNMTAALNPWMIENLAGSANWAQGGGADQVAMMNQMGLNQANTAGSLEQLAALQAGHGNTALTGSGNWILNELANAASDGSNNKMSSGFSGGGGGGGYSSNQVGPVDHLKFQYDQGVFDQSYNNLIGSAQGAFDSYSNKTKTDNLFQNLPGLKIGSQLLGGANTKVGQAGNLLDAMTNQQIMDYGAQMQQWASGTADANAMNAGANTLQAQTGAYQSNVSANASMASAAMSAAASRANAQLNADTQRYNSLVGAASNMYGYGTQLLGDAGTSLNGANAGYGNAANTFAGANEQMNNNWATSLGASDYLQQYDQGALDRFNQANIYNMERPWNMQMDKFNAINGVPTGQSTTNSPSLFQAAGNIASIFAGFG